MSPYLVSLPFADAGLSAPYSYLQGGNGSQPGPVGVGRPQQSALRVGTATAALLPAAAAQAEVVVVVPAAALSWHRLNLPAGLTATSPRLRAVLGGLLEDRLLDDEDSLHFALAPAPGTAPGGQTWVAACAKAWLHGHLQALEAAQLSVSRVVPEFVPSAGALQLHALGGAESACWVMTGEAVGGLLHLPFSAAALSMVPGLGGLNGPDQQQTLAVFAEPALAAQAEHWSQTPAALVMPAERWLDAARGPWDLAQFDLARSARSRRVKKLSSAVSQLFNERQWRPARWGAAVFLLANLIGLNVWAWQQTSQLDATRSAIKNVLVQTFPSVTVVVDAPLQMQREVNALRQTSGAASSGDLEPMLAALAAAAPTSRVATVDFSAGELKVKGVADKPQTSSQAGNQGGSQDSQTPSAVLKAKGYAAQLEADTFVVKPNSKVAP